MRGPRVTSLGTLALAILAGCVAASQRDAHQTRDFQTLGRNDIEALVQLDPPEWTSVDEGHLAKLLIPRASGSENNTLVQNYISSVFKRLGWHEEQTPFRWETPIGEVDFTNLIYTFDPDAPRKIVIAAHFDSKHFDTFPANQFIGATDSAAPCSFMLDLAEALTPLLRARKDRVAAGSGLLRDGFDEEEAAETTLQLLFLDGEEAFHDWTDTDSIYGARFLAQEWADTYLPSSHPLSSRRFAPPPTTLETIDVFVLLDLLGNDHTRLQSFYRETDWLFDEMRGVDRRLQETGLVEVVDGQAGWFQDQRLHGGIIGDDHVPFLARGVSILHLISNPFPSVWHTLRDDASALSMPAMRRWNRILRVFTAEYLGLAPEDMEREPSRADRAMDELLPSG